MTAGVVVFELICEVYDEAVAAIDRHRQQPQRNRPRRKLRSARFDDIDFEAAMATLDTIRLSLGPAQKKTILHWVIF